MNINCLYTIKSPVFNILTYNKTILARILYNEKRKKNRQLLVCITDLYVWHYFMLDLKVYAEGKDELEESMATVGEVSTAIGMQLGLRKNMRGCICGQMGGSGQHPY